MAKKEEKTVYAEVVLRSRTGTSLIKDAVQVTRNSFQSYYSDVDTPAAAQERLEAAGFTVIAASRFGLSITGPEGLYRDYFKANVVERPVQMLFGGSLRHEANAFFMEDTPGYRTR
jgi:hypothetical protein